MGRNPNKQAPAFGTNPAKKIADVPALRKQIAQIGKRRKERLRDEGSETDVFRRIYEDREGRSDLSDEFIYEPRTWCFAHILPKGMFSQYRLDPNNIALVADEKEHKRLDALVARCSALDIMEILDAGESPLPLILSE